MRCDSCLDKTLFIKDNKCLKCSALIPNCESCSTDSLSSDKCNKCEDGYSTDIFSQKCTKCPAGCKTCTNMGCQSCLDPEKDVRDGKCGGKGSSVMVLVVILLAVGSIAGCVFCFMKIRKTDRNQNLSTVSNKYVSAETSN